MSVIIPILSKSCIYLKNVKSFENSTFLWYLLNVYFLNLRRKDIPIVYFGQLDHLLWTVARPLPKHRQLQFKIR